MNHYFPVGDVFTGAMSSLAGTSTCNPATATASDGWRLVGTELAPTSLVPLAAGTAGSSRLQYPTVSFEGHTVAEASGDEYTAHRFRDTTLDVSCSIATAADGVNRCLPTGVPTIYYKDAVCTQPVAATLACSPPTSTKYAVTVTRREGCVAPTRVYPTGAAITKPSALYRYDFDFGCVPVDLTTIASVMDVGAEMSPSSFVSLSFGTE